MKIEKDNSISIDGFQKGIGQSVLDDFSDMMGVNVDNNNGIASVNFKFNKLIDTIEPTTFTAATNDIITTAGSLWYRNNALGLAVTLTTTDTLPAGLAVDTIYYVINLTTSTGLYKLASSLENASAGTAVDITDTGTGTHTITPVLPRDIKHWTENNNGDVFALDSYQRVWFIDNIGSYPYLIAGNTDAGIEGQGYGIIYYKGYVLVFASDGVDALTNINAYDDAITWNLAFDDITISTSPNAIPYLSVNDDAIYFYNGAVTGRYYQIGLLEEVAGQTFDPTSGATFDFVADVFTIPYDGFYGQPTTINEISQYIIVGTDGDNVYFWDKKSPSFTTFLKLQEKGVKKIEVIDNMAYIFMTNSGNIYQTNTVSAGLVINVPERLTNEYYNFIPGVDAYVTNYVTVNKREIIFSVSIVGTTTSNYIMSYNLDKEVLTKKNISAYGETSERGGADYGRIYSIYNKDGNLLISSSDYTSSGGTYDYAIESINYESDAVTGTEYPYVYDNYEPYIITGLVSYGQSYSKKTVRELQVSFARALATGQGIKVYYRRDDSSSWTLLKTIDYATEGAIKDIKTVAPITDIVDLQIKITMAGTNLTTPRLKYLRLIP